MPSSFRSLRSVRRSSVSFGSVGAVPLVALFACAPLAGCSDPSPNAPPDATAIGATDASTVSPDATTSTTDASATDGSASDATSETSTDAPVDAGPEPTLAIPCGDTIDSIYVPPTSIPAKGTLIKCAKEGHLSKADVQARLDAVMYSGTATSGAWTYRLQFATERGDDAKTPAVSGAAVMIPDNPRAAKLPVVIASRGSRGQGPNCAPSKRDAAAASVNPDLDRMEMGLVGNGFTFVLPDGPGYIAPGPTNPPPVYFSTTDMGRTMLNGAAALRAMLPTTALTNDVVIVGHSEGAANALSSLAIADSYGVAGKIAGVVTYAPIWFTPRTWSGSFLLASGYPTMGNEAVTGIVLWYHYTHAELFDGVGTGKTLLASMADDAGMNIADVASNWAANNCWGQWDPLEGLGHDVTNVFSTQFQNAVSVPAGTGSPCSGDSTPADVATCTKWLAREDADRPHLTGAAATTPIFATFGLKDTFVGQDRFQCGIDRLKTDGANVKWCVSKTADHSMIVSEEAAHVADWIAARTLGAAEPTPCALDETANVDAMGMPIACASLPPNTP